MLPDATKDLLHFTTIKNLKVPCGSPSFKNKNKNASNSPIPFPSMTKLSELCTMFFTFLPFTIQFNAIQPFPHFTENVLGFSYLLTKLGRRAPNESNQNNTYKTTRTRDKDNFLKFLKPI